MRSTVAILAGMKRHWPALFACGSRFHEDVRDGSRMIRRVPQDQVGESLVLIDQIEHARLAGQLAQAWGNNQFPLVARPEITIPAIFRHDDGWEIVDRRPVVAKKSHLPIQFTEMDLEPAHEIWRESIDLVADLGPLAQYIVAAHFVALRQRGDRSDEHESQRFITEETFRCESWLDQWNQLAPEQNTSEVAHLCLAYLQLFDALSLWLCCVSEPAAGNFESPRGSRLTVTQAPATTVFVEPWPFAESTVRISIIGTSVSGRSFANQREFDACTKRKVELTWRFLQTGQKLTG